ncbi:MAG: hypothetical protein FIB01_10190 [Gemmatimonadetes bacterium]|nr:hypothetical protein [Gemmatimonadota bacterium]
MAGRLAAQVEVVATSGSFVPGTRVLFATDFSADTVGSFPRNLKYLTGSASVAEKNGKKMLRSAAGGEFIIQLSEQLPVRFTLEFDVVARETDCCAGEELAVEGTPSLARTAGSAQLLWHHQYVAILGGGRDMGNSTVRLDPTLQAELLGQLGRVQVAVDSTRVQLFTNGKRLYDFPNVPFSRGSVIRVFLGGLDNGERAVYLARVRVAESGVSAVPTVADAPLTTTSAAPVTTAAPPTAPATATTAATRTIQPQPSPVTTKASPVITQLQVLYSHMTNVDWNEIVGARWCRLQVSLKSDTLTYSVEPVPCTGTSFAGKVVVGRFDKRNEYPFAYVFRLFAVFPDGTETVTEVAPETVAPFPLLLVGLQTETGGRKLKACPDAQYTPEGTSVAMYTGLPHDWYWWRVWGPGLPPEGKFWDMSGVAAPGCLEWAYAFRGAGELVPITVAPTDEQGTLVVPQAKAWRIEWVTTPTTSTAVGDRVMSCISTTYPYADCPIKL